MINKTIIVTGGTGFIGKKFIEKAVLSGYKVINIGRKKNNNRSEYIGYMTWNELFTADTINRDGDACVIHLATHYARNDVVYTDALYSNTFLPLKLLESCRRLGVKKFINVDSFYCKNGIIYEKMPQYCETKNSFKHLAEKVAKSEAIEFATARLEHVYGEMDNCDKFIPWLIREMKKKSEVIRLTDGSQLRDFVYVGDVVDALLEIANHTENENCCEYEIGTGITIKLRTLVEKIATKLDFPLEKIKFGALPNNSNELLKSVANLERIRQIGWHPRMSIDEGINITISQNGD